MFKFSYLRFRNTVVCISYSELTNGKFLLICGKQQFSYCIYLFRSINPFYQIESSDNDDALNKQRR